MKVVTSKEKNNFFIRNKNTIIEISIVFLVFFVLIFHASYSYYNKKLENEEIAKAKQKLFEDNQEKYGNNVINNVDSLFENDMPKENLTIEKLSMTIHMISLINDDNIKEELFNKIEGLDNFVNFINLKNELYQDNILVSSTTQDSIDNLLTMYNDISDQLKEKYASDIADINSQMAILSNSYTLVRNLYNDDDLTSIRYYSTRDEYSVALTSVNSIKQEDIKSNYLVKLNQVLSTIEQREAAEQRQREIDAAWVILDTPYVSQNNLEVYNGCECASLLMGLQYKGYLKDKTLYDVAASVPKTDDPHTGFIYDIYGYDPRDVAHWIAPDALASFGVSYSGNSNVVDATGYSFSKLEKEIQNGNPVVIYLTNMLLSTPNWSSGQEVPTNLHVMLLVGYNSVSKQVVISDPWTRNNSSSRLYYSEDLVASIYNQVGKKAVVIR